MKTKIIATIVFSFIAGGWIHAQSNTVHSSSSSIGGTETLTTAPQPGDSLTVKSSGTGVNDGGTKTAPVVTEKKTSQPPGKLGDKVNASPPPK